MAHQGAAVLLLWTLFLLYSFYILDLSHLRSLYNIDRRQETLDCSTDLSKDLYGLGVRLGYYFQWFSGWVSNNFIVEELAGGLDANSIFLGSLIISILNTTKNNTLTQIDAFILLQLCAGTIWSVLSVWGYRTCVYRKEGADGIRRFGGFGTHLRLMLGAAVGGYMIWFWTVGVRGIAMGGIDPYSADVPRACNKVSVFNVDISGPIRHATVGVGLASVIYTLLLTLAAPLAAITRIRKLVFFIREGHYGSSSRLRYATGANQDQLRIMSLVFGAFNLIWMLFMMTLIEITLNENKILGVLGARGTVSTDTLLQPGQLLPLLIGTFSFTRCLFITFELYRHPDGDISPSLGRAESKRGTKVNTNAKRSSNVFKMFAAANEVPEEEHNLVQQSPKEDAEKAVDPFMNFYKRLTPFQKVMVTWLPWLSLLFFWPWTEDRGLPVPQDEDHSSPALVSGTHRTRYSEYDSDMTSMDNNKRVSQISLEDYPTRPSQGMV